MFDKLVKARKEYICCETGLPIHVGDEYYRVNVKGFPVMHFHSSTTFNDRKNYYMNVHYLPHLRETDEYGSFPMYWDEEEQERWRMMPNEF